VKLITHNQSSSIDDWGLTNTHSYDSCRHYHFTLKGYSNLVHSATFTASTRSMPGSYLDKDTDYPEMLRGFSLSLLANAGTALLITLRPLYPSSCSL